MDVRDIAVKYALALDATEYSALLNAADEIERLQKIQAGLHKECDTFAGECERLREALHDSMEAAIRRDTRLRAALADAHDVLANGGDLNTDTYQTRCNRALAITREALHGGES